MSPKYSLNLNQLLHNFHVWLISDHSDDIRNPWTWTGPNRTVRFGNTIVASSKIDIQILTKTIWSNCFRIILGLIGELTPMTMLRPHLNIVAFDKRQFNDFKRSTLTTACHTISQGLRIYQNGFLEIVRSIFLVGRDWLGRESLIRTIIWPLLRYLNWLSLTGTDWRTDWSVSGPSRDYLVKYVCKAHEF